MKRSTHVLVIATCLLALLLPEVSEAGRRRRSNSNNWPVPQLVVSSPLQGDFVLGTSATVTGQLIGKGRNTHTLFLNDVEVVHDANGFFSHNVTLDLTRVFQPILMKMLRDNDAAELYRDFFTIHRGESVADGSLSYQSIALHLDDKGLDKIEPRITELVPIDLATLLPPGTVIIDDYEYFCLIFCLTTDVVINGGGNSPSIGSYEIAIDSLAANGGSVESIITMNQLFVSTEATALGCDINVTANTATIDGDYDLTPDGVDPSTVDVTQLAPGVGVAFGGFNDNTDCGGGFGGGLLEILINLLIGDIQGLVQDAFIGFLNVNAPGEDDPPIAAALEEALAGIEISGPIGASLGVILDTPLFDIPISNDGVTLGNDSSIVSNVGTGPEQCDAPIGVPNLNASYHVDEAFPTFGVTAPVSGDPFDLGLCISTSAFNQLLKAETECGLMVSAITQVSGSPLTSTLLRTVFPILANEFAAGLPAWVEVRPQLAPVITGDAGPFGELARLEIGHLLLSFVINDYGTETTIASTSIGLEMGLDLVFDDILNALEFQLGPLNPANVSVIITDNPYGLGEAPAANLIATLLPAGLASITSALGSFPLPEFFGLELHGVETSKNGQFMSLFADLVPGGTIANHDYTGAQFGTTDIALVGDAHFATDNDPIFVPHPNRLRLTTNGVSQNGSAWYTGHQIDPTQDWSSTSRIQLSYQVSGGADGLGFHVQSDGVGANPDHEGGGLVNPHVSVVIDTWNNTEGTDESLKVFLNGTQVYFNNLLDFPSDPHPGSSVTVFRLEVGYDSVAQTLRVALFDEGGSGDFLDDTIAMDLSAFGAAHAGFSGKTGGAAENHDIRSFQLSATPF